MQDVDAGQDCLFACLAPQKLWQLLCTNSCSSVCIWPNFCLIRCYRGAISWRISGVRLKKVERLPTLRRGIDSSPHGRCDPQAVVCSCDHWQLSPQPNRPNQLLSNRSGRVGPIGLKRAQSTQTADSPLFECVSIGPIGPKPASTEPV